MIIKNLNFQFMNFPFFKFPSERIFRLNFIFLSFFNSTVFAELFYFLLPSKFWGKLFICTRCCQVITYLSFICKFLLCYCSERGSSNEFKKAEFNCVSSFRAVKLFEGPVRYYSFFWGDQNCSLLMFNKCFKSAQKGSGFVRK